MLMEEAAPTETSLRLKPHLHGVTSQKTDVFTREVYLKKTQSSKHPVDITFTIKTFVYIN